MEASSSSCSIRLLVVLGVELTGLVLLDLLLDSLLALLVSELWLVVLLRGGLVLVDALCGLLALGWGWVLPDLLVGLLVDLLHVLGTDVVGEVLGELLLESLVILLLEGLHVFGDVPAVDVLPQDLAVELLGLWVVAWESVLGVGDEHATVRGALEDTKDTRAGRGALETGVEEALEWAWLVVAGALGELEFTLWLGDTLVLVSKAELGEGTSSNEETDGVGWKGGSERVQTRILRCQSSRLRSRQSKPLSPNSPADQLVRPCLMPYRGSS